MERAKSPSNEREAGIRDVDWGSEVPEPMRVWARATAKMMTLPLDSKERARAFLEIKTGGLINTIEFTKTKASSVQDGV